MTVAAEDMEKVGIEERVRGGGTIPRPAHTANMRVPHCPKYL
jgi:hypothetical protein